MTSSLSFLVLAALAFVVLMGVVAVSIVVGAVRSRAGDRLSAEIERAAGMEGRWRSPGSALAGAQHRDAA